MSIEKKAKLRYDDISFYEKDLNNIGILESKKYNGVFDGFMIDRNNGVLIINFKLEGQLRNSYIPFENLKKYIISKIEKKEPKKNLVNLVYDKKKYTDLKLMEIGKSLAESWGGSCESYSINRKLERIVFNCIESGEHFTMDLPFYDLKKY